MSSKKIVAITSSPNKTRSKSKAAVFYTIQYISNCLRQKNDTVDAQCFDIYDLYVNDPSFTSPKAREIINHIRSSDALILGSPIYNWNVSEVLIGFLNRVINHNNPSEYQICMFVGGADSMMSLFAFESISRSLVTETNAIILGKPIIADNNNVTIDNNKNIVDISNTLKNNIRSHIDQMIKLLDIQ